MKLHGPVTRFWSKVEKGEGCWNWTASKTSVGYGKFEDKVNGKWVTELAHRVSYTLAYGSIPEGMCVLHHCDNRLCVNPKHLFLGTKRDNAHDSMSKSRHNFGQRHGNATMSNQQVREIYNRFQKGEMQVSIANDLQIPLERVNRIVRGRGWRKITGFSSMKNEPNLTTPYGCDRCDFTSAFPHFPEKVNEHKIVFHKMDYADICKEENAAWDAAEQSE